MKNNIKNIVLIDADSLAYIGTSTDTLPQILQKVDDKINSILAEANADYYSLFISKGKYFRHKLKNASEDKGSYKANRTYQSQPYNQVVKAYLEAEWGAVWYPNVEADDIISYIMNQNLYIYPNNTIYTCKISDLDSVGNVIMAAVDKDLLQSIPGKHLNYNKKTGPDTWEMVWVETSKEDSWFYEWEAMVCGDNADGVAGLYRKGKAWCDKNFTGKSLREVQLLVFDEYCKEHGDISKAIYEFQKSWRSLHILNINEDFTREIGYVPELPAFREFKKETESEVKFD